MCQTTFKYFEVIWPAWAEFFKGCLPQILLGPLWNTLTQINNKTNTIYENSRTTEKHYSMYYMRKINYNQKKKNVWILTIEQPTKSFVEELG